MGFKRERSRRSNAEEKTHSRLSRFTYGQASQTRSQSAVPNFRDQAHAEAHYGQEIESAKELHQLQRLEKRYGDRLHGWLEEGMPKKAMGHPQEMADFRIQRSLEGTGTSREDVPGVVLDVIGSQGQSLDGTIQRALEDRMDADFSNVRIHTGAKAADAADAIDAKAFTCGRDIVFNSGAYDPGSPEGQYLLAHELAHVKQQTGAAISMMPQEGAELEIDPDPGLEREADEEAARVMRGEESGIKRLGKATVHIQRKNFEPPSRPSLTVDIPTPTVVEHSDSEDSEAIADNRAQMQEVLTRIRDHRRAIVSLRRAQFRRLREQQPAPEQIRAAVPQFRDALVDLERAQQQLDTHAAQTGAVGSGSFDILAAEHELDVAEDDFDRVQDELDGPQSMAELIAQLREQLRTQSNLTRQ